jgi:hypothetical protein
VLVFHPEYDGHRTAMRQVVERGEVVERPIPMTVAAHCICPIGEWIRARTDREILSGIPFLGDVLVGRGRWQASDPTRDERGEYSIDFVRAGRDLAAKMEAK